MGIERISQNRKDYYGLSVEIAKTIPAGSLYLINSRNGILPLMTYVWPALKLLIAKKSKGRRGVSREVCKICHRENPIGFHVPNMTWSRIVPKRLRTKVICIGCFIMLAEARKTDWAERIKLYPVNRLREEAKDGN